MNAKQKILKQYQQSIQNAKNTNIVPRHKYDVAAITKYFSTGGVPDDLVHLLKEAYDKLIVNIISSDKIQRGQELNLFLNDYKIVLDQLQEAQRNKEDNIILHVIDIDLKNIRTLNKLTQIQFAKMLNISVTTYAELENKNKVLPKRVFESLKIALKTLRYKS